MVDAQPEARFVRPVALAAVLVALCFPGRARAAEPTTAECLAASVRSLKSGADHRLRAERVELLTCAAASCPKIVRAECMSRVTEVNAQLPTLLVDVKDATGSDVTAVKVRMDGEVLADHLDGTAIAVDPGEHTFSFETSGRDPIVRTFLILEAQKDRREVVTLGTKPVAASTVARAESYAPGVPAAGLGKQKIASVVVGAAGLVGLGVGTVFGAVALSQKSDAQAVCSAAACATSDGVNKWSRATSSGEVSTASLIVGGVLVAGAAVLWLTAPGPSRSANTQIGLGVGTVQWKGTW